MPYRKTYRRKTGIRRKTRAVRPFKMFRRPRLQKPNTYFYKQTLDGSSIVGIGTRTITQQAGVSNYACEFRVSNLPNWAALSALYDQFCISKIVLKLLPMVNTNGVQPLAGSTLLNPGILGTVVDIDDGTPLSILADYEQYQSFKFQPAIAMRQHTRVFVPAIRTVTVATGGTQQPGAPKKKQWIDCTYSTTSHFGCKIYLDAYGNFNAPACYQILATYYVKFRNVR